MEGRSGVVEALHQRTEEGTGRGPRAREGILEDGKERKGGAPSRLGIVVGGAIRSKRMCL